MNVPVVRSPAPEREKSAGFVPLALPTLIGLIAIYGAQSVKIQALERILFAVTVAAALMLASRSFGGPLPARTRHLSVLWVAGCSFFLLVSLFQAAPEPKYIVGDFALALMPLLVLLAFAARPEWLQDLRIAYSLATLLIVAALLAKPLGTLGPRHDPPSAFVIAATWYFLIRTRNPVAKAGWLIVVLAIGYLAYDSGFRTHVVLWAAAPAITLAVTHGRRAMLGAVAAALVAYVGLGLAQVDIEIDDALDDSRFQTFVRGAPDASLDIRLLEIRDVLRTAEKEWVPGQVLVGTGFGGSYQPHHSYIEPNVGENNRVHNIHIGPALVFFRFGLLGCVLFFAGLWWFILRLRRLRALPNAERPLATIFAVTVALFLLQFIVLNSTVEPPFSFALGGLLASWGLNPGSPPRSDAEARY